MFPAPRHPLRIASALLALALAVALGPGLAHADDGTPTGDIGIGFERHRQPMRGVRTRNEVVPYLNLEGDRLFARIDTFGVKTVPLGDGHLELVVQARQDGYSGDGLARRRDSIPIGLGTLQITPYGAFMVDVLHDVGRSHGQLAQALYAAEVPLGRATLYPQVGVEWLSGAYDRYYFSPCSGEAAPYRAGSATQPFAGLLLEVHLGGAWYLDTTARVTVLGRSVANSPLVQRPQDLTGLVALAYRL